MKFVLVAIFRLCGFILSCGILLGYLWSAAKLPWTLILPALFLLLLSVLPSDTIRRYPMILILGGIGSIADILVTGLHFFRTDGSSDVEIMYILQWVLIVYFVIQTLLGDKKTKEKKPEEN